MFSAHNSDVTRAARRVPRTLVPNNSSNSAAAAVAGCGAVGARSLRATTERRGFSCGNLANIGGDHRQPTMAERLLNLRSGVSTSNTTAVPPTMTTTTMATSGCFSSIRSDDSTFGGLGSIFSSSACSQRSGSPEEGRCGVLARSGSTRANSTDGIRAGTINLAASLPAQEQSSSRRQLVLLQQPQQQQQRQRRSDAETSSTFSSLADAASASESTSELVLCEQRRRRAGVMRAVADARAAAAMAAFPVAEATVRRDAVEAATRMAALLTSRFVLAGSSGGCLLNRGVEAELDIEASSLPPCSAGLRASTKLFAEIHPRLFFASRRIPPMTLVEYCRCLQHFLSADADTVVIATVLALRFSSVSTTASTSNAKEPALVPLTPHTAHRIALAAMAIARKLHSEAFISTSFVATAGGVVAWELCHLEIAFLSVLEWSTFVSPVEHAACAEQMAQHPVR